MVSPKMPSHIWRRTEECPKDFFGSEILAKRNFGLGLMTETPRIFWVAKKKGEFFFLFLYFSHITSANQQYDKRKLLPVCYYGIILIFSVSFVFDQNQNWSWSKVLAFQRINKIANVKSMRVFFFRACKKTYRFFGYTISKVGILPLLDPLSLK